MTELAESLLLAKWGQILRVFSLLNRLSWGKYRLIKLLIYKVTAKDGLRMPFLKFPWVSAQGIHVDLDAG